jgi:putative molybdopterin biosynthesis protein
VVTLVDRDQGLMVAPGNPHKLAGLADLAKPGVRLINRQPGSGTRSLLDYRLRLAGVAPDAVQGYRSVAATHLAVAMAVAEGRADVGLGLYAAARAYGLEFIPQARERYDLVMFAEDRQQAPLASLIEAARAPDFKTLVAGLGGYDTARTGEETYL